MERGNKLGIVEEEEEELRRVNDYIRSFPPGHWFKPTDNELIVDYLTKKVFNKSLPNKKSYLDSSLPFPSSLASYVSETIRPSFQLFSEFQRFFRVVHAPIFLCSLASDRRHMKDSLGNWIAQPPAYESIVAEDGTALNLNEYIEISTADLVKNIGVDLINAVPSQKLGIVVSETQLEEFFSLIS